MMRSQKVVILQIFQKHILSDGCNIDNIQIEMIRNLQKIDKVSWIRVTTMNLISRIIKSTTSNSFIFFFLYTLISTITSLSVLFINSPLYPSESNQLFQVFIISTLSQIFGVNEDSILIALNALFFLILILILVTLHSTTLVYPTKVMAMLMVFLKVLLVPLAFYFLQNIGNLFTTNQDAKILILRLVYILQSLLILSFILCFSYFSIHPLQVKNILWNYSQAQPFLRIILSLCRAIAIICNTQTIILLLLSLMVEWRLFQMDSPWLCPETKLIDQSAHFLTILIHLSLLVAQILNNSSMGFLMVLLSFILYFAFIGLKFFTMKNEMQEIPLCKKENCALMYAFFVDFKTRSGVIGSDFSRKIKLHLMVCESDICIYKEDFSYKNMNISAEEIQQKISKFLKIFRSDSPEFELMYELWKIETNKSTSLSHQMRPFSIEHQFIVQHVLGAEETVKGDNNLSVAIVSSSNSSTADNPFKLKFYKQLSLAVDQFEKLGQILSKPLPEVNQIIQTVIDIDSNASGLTSIFEEMIRSKQTNYVCIELYLKFYDTFFNENKLSSDVIEKLKRLKILIDSDLIEENPLPCFIIDAETTMIENANAQGMKFLRMHRFELKDKTFNDFLTSNLDTKTAYSHQVASQGLSKLPLFFKVKYTERTKIQYRNINLKPMKLQNKNFFQLSITVKQQCYNGVHFLIDNHEKIVAVTSEKILLPFCEDKQIIDFSEIYEQRILPILHTISHERMSRVEFGDLCLVSGRICQKPYPCNSNFRLMTMTFMKEIVNNRSMKVKTQHRISRVFKYNESFTFSYKINHRRAVLAGGCEGPDSNENQNQLMPSDHMLANAAEPSVNENQITNYCEGIRIYRLYEGDLYNIDLEDRGKYEELFNEMHEAGNSSKHCGGMFSNTSFFVVLLILFSSVAIICSLFLSIMSGNSLSSIEREQTKLLQIEQFSLNFNRVLAVLRDKANGMFDTLGDNFLLNLMDSYKEIQNQETSNFFSSTIHEAVYINQKYSGSLSQLIEVALTHVYEYLQTLEEAIVEKIHNLSILYLGPFIENEKFEKQITISSLLEEMKSYSLICYLLIVGGGVMYYFMYILISRQFLSQLSEFLNPLLIISENESKRILDECEKFKNAISSSYKNYDIDLDTFGKKSQGRNMRGRPKKINLSICSLITELLVGGITVTILIGCSSLQFNTILNESLRMTKFIKESEAIIQSFSGVSWSANEFDHLGRVNMERIYNLTNRLDIIEYNKDNYEFNPELSKTIEILFFNDSCSYLVSKSIIDPKYCLDFMNGFRIKNPFKIGMLLFLRRANYNLISNLIEAFGSNGIFSQPFKDTFNYLSQQIQIETKEKMQAMRTTLLIFSIIITVLSFWLLLVFMISNIYFKRKIRKLSKGLASLLGDNQEIKKEEPEGPMNEQVESKVDEQDFLMPAQEGQDSIYEF